MKILVRAPNWLGDAVLATPALSAISRTWPDAAITLVAKPLVCELYQGLPGIDGMRIAPRSNPAGRLHDLPQLGGALRREKFDLGIAFPGAFSAALLLYLAGAKRRVGYDMEGRGRLLTTAIPTHETEGQHLSEQYLHLVRRAGATTDPGRVSWPLTEHDRRLADDLLASEGISPADAFIAMAPGATFGPAKRWPADRFGEVAWHVSTRYGLPVVLVGSTPEREDAVLVARRGGQGVVDLTGRTTVRALAALLSRALLLVSNDSGIMHVAGAVGTPVVAVFGSTSPAWTRPLGDGHRIISHSLPCAPCFQRTCDIGYVCLRSITVDEVLSEVAQSLFVNHKRTPSAPPPERPSVVPRPERRDERHGTGPIEVIRG